MSNFEKDEQGRILCVGCDRPIKANELGAITNLGMVHNNMFCLIEYNNLRKKRTKENETQTTT
jgi:hypothetical protein